MKDRRNGSRLSVVIALTASLVVGGQIASILLRGETVCPNGGCQVVEELTSISPLFFNLLGLGYFLVVAGVVSFASRMGKKDAFFPSLLLLAGAGVEGALLSYQQFAVRTFCSYCLIVAGFVLLLNLLQGFRQVARAALVFGSVVLASSLLNFGPALLLSRAESVQAGVYAERQGDAAAGRFYLFLSSSCPHCRTVLASLDRFPRCTVAINPISATPPDVSSLPIKTRQKFSPEANRLLLTLLDIKEIPVLLEYTDKDNLYTLHIGEKSILQTLQAQCAPLPSTVSRAKSYEGMSTPLDGQEEGECTIDEECPQ